MLTSRKRNLLRGPEPHGYLSRSIIRERIALQTSSYYFHNARFDRVTSAARRE